MNDDAGTAAGNVGGRMDVVAVLLAAGGGTRFAGATHKLLAMLDGRPVFEHAVESVLAADVGAVVVVTGGVELALPDGVTVAHNPAWADGQATSLRAGVEAAAALGAEAVVVGLADQPFVPPAAWRAVATAPAEWPIVVAAYDGRRGPNPVRLARSMWPSLPMSGDEGARSLIRGNPSLVREVPCSGSAADIDTLEDLNRWTSS
jgi:CTP:molybdopterin cytidylyltransferase MocA